MKNNLIQSLDRGLKILNILGKSSKPLSLSEISAHFSIDRSSVYRLVCTLIKNDFVKQDPDTKKYSLNYKVMELAGSFSEQEKIENIIRPIMRDVCIKTKQNTHLAVLDKNEVVFIAVEQPRESVAVNITVGIREPVAPTALGKALISFLEEEELNRFLSAVKLKPYTKNSVISKKEYRHTIDEIRKNRLAVDNEEYKNDIICFAAPIFDNSNRVQYSIGISGHASLIEPYISEYSEIVRQAGMEVSSLLGSSMAVV